jgi:predicted PurR-regulated permease PerM
MEQIKTISISTGTIFRIIAICFALWFVYMVRNVVGLLFVSLVLASAFDRWVDWMQAKKIPRALGILFIYIIVFASFSSIFSILIPALATELRGLAIDLPKYWQALSSQVLALQTLSSQVGILDQFQGLISSVESSLVHAGQGLVSSAFSAFGGIVSFVLVLVLTFYMTIDEHVVKRAIRAALPEEYQPFATHALNRTQEKVGVWLQGQLVLSLIIGTLVYIGLSLIGVKYALVLAILAGLLEFVPYVGPILAAIPAVLFGLTQSVVLAGLTIVLYVVIQQLENHLIVPAVMKKALGIHPILSISAILIGAQLFGFIGILLAIPVVTVLMVIVQDVLYGGKTAPTI